MNSAVMLGVCLSLASDPGASLAFIPTESFTLAWEHSIEKLRWEEDYLVVHRKGQAQLQAGTARIQGSAAGMEPPPDAVWRQGWYEYQPPRWPATPLRLTRSEFAADYEWCVDGVCQPLSALLPSDGNITLLAPCTKPH